MGEYELKSNPGKKLHFPDEVIEKANEIYEDTVQFMYENLTVGSFNIDANPLMQDAFWISSAYNGIYEAAISKKYRGADASFNELLSKQGGPSHRFLENNKNLLNEFMIYFLEAQKLNKYYTSLPKDVIQNFTEDAKKRLLEIPNYMIQDEWIEGNDFYLDEIIKKRINGKITGICDESTKHLKIERNYFN